MRYYSLNKQSPIVDFKTATLQGQAPDKGLYFPEYIPQLSQRFINAISSSSKEAIGYEVIKPFVGDAIPNNILEQIVAETVNFPFPLVEINANISSLELYHGPTLAFKDVGARFMSRCLGYFVKGIDKKVTVLVATSGDTGGAVANGFYDVDGVDVVILYPSGKVSSVQELQLTTLGKNITALEVNGTFDDCQQMVKQAFVDADLVTKLFLTSANSINVARWLPQQFYYFNACQQWKDKSNLPVVSVPSGNFGNICAGILAHISGLPFAHFIAACNANDTVPDFLRSGIYQTKPAVATISNAMDVGSPSNFVRVLALFHNQFGDLNKNLSAYSINDDETRNVVNRVNQNHDYLLDPHGAVAYAALEQYLNDHPSRKGIILETAHPVKFYDVVEPIIGKQIEMPAAIQAIVDLKKKSITMDASYDALKTFLLDKA